MISISITLKTVSEGTEAMNRHCTNFKYLILNSIILGDSSSTGIRKYSQHDGTAARAHSICKQTRVWKFNHVPDHDNRPNRS